MQTFDYSIDRREVLRYLGYKGQQLQSELLGKIDGMISTCLKTAAPLYGFNIFDIAHTADGVLLKESGTLLSGKDIARHLRGAEKCAVMAVTIGAAVERKLAALEYKDMPDALIFNAACTALTEKVAERCCADIAASAGAKGYTAGLRFSPGYGDFPLESQKDILLLLDSSRRLGITLTDTLLMIPRKSITAVAGLYKNSEDASKDYGCSGCSNKGKCEYER